MGRDEEPVLHRPWTSRVSEGGGVDSDVDGADTGRRLRVQVEPANPFASWWLAPVGDGLRRAVIDVAEPGRDGPRSVLCEFGDAGPTAGWRAWPTLGSRAYGGEDVDRVVLTVPRVVAARFQPGRPIDIFVGSPGPALRRVPGGVLDGPAADPEWLVRTVVEQALARFVVPVANAPHPWQARVRRAAVTSDGGELRLEVDGNDDEILTRVDVEESQQRVGLRAWVAFGPNGPRRPGRLGGPRVLADGRRVRTAMRKGTGRRWSTRIRLRHPLGVRAVVDLATPTPNDREQARRAWHTENG